VLWNQNVHTRVHNSPSFVAILSHKNRACGLPTGFFRIHLNIIVSFRPNSSKWSLSLRFPHKNPCAHHMGPHAPYNPLFLISSSRQYLVRCRNNESYQCAISSSPLLPCPSWTKTLISSPAVYSLTLLAYILPLI